MKESNGPHKRKTIPNKKNDVTGRVCMRVNKVLPRDHTECDL